MYLLKNQVVMSIYIQSASQISFQQPLCEKWLDEPILPIQSFNQPMEPDYKQFIAPAESRRMGKLLKRAVALSLRDSFVIVSKTITHKYLVLVLQGSFFISP